MPAPVAIRPFGFWLLLSALGASVLLMSLGSNGRAREVFLPGKTTHGHYQIELACESCHTSSFADARTIQTACEGCHAAELARADDTHPRSKFTDPRNADRIAVLDARQCVTCHSEHNPAITQAMGLTLPDDYCYHCHQNIGKERASHATLSFSTCADSGCHKFHDNQALYEDFLLQHLDEPPNLDSQRVAALANAEARTSERTPLVRTAFDAPPALSLPDESLDALEASVHSRAGVNCRECHAAAADATWQISVSTAACESCHEREVDGWQRGRHGMRALADLPSLYVSEARAPMRATQHDRQLDCQSCHGAHAYDTRRAAADACTGCHTDEHSQNYETSAHARAFREELALLSPPGSGVSCATCHLPRRLAEGEKVSFVVHNQNENLRPSEKMVRSVCLDCHGLGFTLDSLADADLVRRNFTGQPKARVASLDFVRARHPETPKGGGDTDVRRSPNDEKKE